MAAWEGTGGGTGRGSGRRTVIKVAAYNYTKMQSSKIRPIYFRRKNKATYAVSLKKGVSLRSL
jgi:penicillin-binding protein-related factor A (putative recombinase)